MKNKILNIETIKHKNSDSFFLIAGPCVVENELMPLEIAKIINDICDELEIPFIFKASYRKANRSKGSSFSGIGDIKALKAIELVKNKLNIPITSDIHTKEEAKMAANYVDIIQIPAFLCRQTDLLEEAAKTNKWINIKKGQFLSPEAMEFAANKVSQCGNDKIILTERGTTFGYNDLIVDYRSIPIMQKIGYPVVLDVTHSLQKPNQSSGITGGNPTLISTIAKAGIAVGVDGIFIETHPKPEKALSDGANMLNISELKNLLSKLVNIKKSLN